MKSLRTFFISMSLGITFVIFAALTAYNLFQFDDIIAGEVQNQLKTQAEKEANEFNSRLREIAKENILCAKNIEVSATIDTNNILKTIAGYIQLDPMVLGSGFWLEPGKYDPQKEFYGPYVYKDKGNIQVTWDYSNAQYNYFQYDWYKNGLQAVGKVAWTEPYHDPVLNLNMITSSSAIVKNGVPIGVTTTDINLDVLAEAVSKIKVGQTGYAFIITKQGFYMAHRDAKKNLKAKITDEKDANLKNLGNTIVNDTKSGILTTVIDGVNQYAVYAPIGDTGLKLVMFMPTNETTSGFDLTASFVKNAGLFVVAIAVYGILLSILIKKKLIQPLKNLSNEAERIAGGDLTSLTSEETGRKDEIGILRKAFNTMVGQLRQLILHINQSADNIASTSQILAANSNETEKSTQQVANAIQEVAKGTLEQTKLITETMKDVAQLDKILEGLAAGSQEQIRNIKGTNDFVNQMTASIDEVTSCAHAVAKSAEKTKEAAEKGDHAVKLTTEGMDSIKEKTFEASNKIKELGEHSQHIGEIIQVIDDIAEQTNLLALNAAIEAARAGEHGKGFAVVADEVRKLAERSGNATKEIAKLITDIQKLTAASVSAMEQGTVEVERGVGLAFDARKALQEILQTVIDTYQQTQKILVAAEQMSTSSQKVVNAVNNVSAVNEEASTAIASVSETSHQVAQVMENIVAITEESSAAAEEVTASTEEMTASAGELSTVAEKLAGMSDELKRLITKFKF